MKHTFRFLLLALAALSQPALADGNKLLEECSQILKFAETGYLDEGNVGGSFCMGMVNGMMALNTIYRSQLGNKALFCPPNISVSNADGAKIVVNYLKAHPEQLGEDAGSLMFFAFNDAYPCSGG